jgi:hypothetical protein
MRKLMMEFCLINRTIDATIGELDRRGKGMAKGAAGKLARQIRRSFTGVGSKRGHL